MGACLFVTFLVTAVLGAPIWVVLASSSFVALKLASTTPLLGVVQRMFTSTDSFPLLAIPLFMISGNLMKGGGISRRLIKFCDRTLINTSRDYDRPREDIICDTVTFYSSV